MPERQKFDPEMSYLVGGDLLNEYADLKARIKGVAGEITVTELPDGSLSLGYPTVVVKIVANGRKMRVRMPIIPVQ